MTIFYLQVTVIIDIKSELNPDFFKEKEENFDKLIYNVWKTVAVRLKSNRNILSKDVQSQSTSVEVKRINKQLLHMKQHVELVQFLKSIDVFY